MFLGFFVLGCQQSKMTHQEVVNGYYKARSETNYSEVKKYVSDSLTIVSGDFVMPFDHHSFYEVFKWDSLFRPTYEVVKIEDVDHHIVVSVKLNSVRSEFLKNSYMTCHYKLSFEAGRISKFEEMNCDDVDWNIWEQEVNSLVHWVKEHHPELDGFIHDMTKKGAQNYLRAMELYEKRKESTKEIYLHNK